MRGDLPFWEECFSTSPLYSNPSADCKEEGERRLWTQQTEPRVSARAPFPAQQAPAPSSPLVVLGSLIPSYPPIASAEKPSTVVLNTWCGCHESVTPDAGSTPLSPHH